MNKNRTSLRLRASAFKSFINAETQRRRACQYLCVLSAFWIISAFSVHAESVATVDGTTISIADVRATAARKGYAMDASGTSAALNDAVTFELLAAEAKKLGYFANPEIVRMAKSMAVQKLVAEKVDRQIKRERLTEPQLRAYYDAHSEQFSKPTLARGRVLMVLNNKKGAQTRFNAAVALVQKGKAFAAVVKEYSDDASARANGGMSNWQIQGRETRRYPAPVLHALFELSESGDLSEAIITEKAFYLVQLAERREGQVTDYETAKKTISRKLYARLRQDAYSTYVEALKGDFPVQINAEALKDALETARTGNGPPSGPVLPVKRSQRSE